MGNGVTMRVDTRGFERLLTELQKLSGAPMKAILERQAAAVLDRAIEYTRPPNKNLAKNRATERLTAKFNTYVDGHAGQGNKQSIAGLRFESVPSGADRISISKKTGKVWFGKPGSWHRMNDPERRWSYKRWDAYESNEAQRNIELKNAIRQAASNIDRSRLLSQQSWLQCAESIGIDGLLKKGKSARKALTQAGRSVQNGRAIQGAETGKQFITLINSAPMLVGAKGQGAAILQRAISTRLKAFEGDLRRGVFDDVKTRAARYPGIFVKP